MGRAHDAGKADKRFQDYLRACADGRPADKCPHAFAGAVAAYPVLSFLSLADAGHHAGLPGKA